MNTDLTLPTTKIKEKTILERASEYLRTGAKVNAVCYILGVTLEELETEISEIGYTLYDFIALQKDVGEAELLFSQFTMAKKNPQIAIHLGKVILGQKGPEIDNKGQFKIFGIATIAETQAVKA